MKSDMVLQEDVLEELKWQPNVNAAHIGVSVKEGVVTLTGHVPSYAERTPLKRQPSASTVSWRWQTSWT